MFKDNLKKLATVQHILSSGGSTQLVMKHGMKFTDFTKINVW